MTGRNSQQRPHGSIGVCPTTGKHSYTTRAAAKTIRGRLKGRDLHVYRCDACQLFHLGGDHGVQDRAEHRRIAAQSPVRGLGYPSVPIGHAAAELDVTSDLLARLIDDGRIRGGQIEIDGTTQYRVHADDVARLKEAILRGR